MSEPNQIEGSLDGSGLSVCVVVARWNAFITDGLRDGAVAALTECGVAPDAITVTTVPGSFEIPSAAAWAARCGKFDAVICLGAVIRGETAHFEYVAGAAADGVLNIALDTGVPIVFGVLTVDTAEQALARTGGSDGHKGDESARVAIEMATLRRAFS